MKKIYQSIIVLAITLVVTSCSSDSTETISGIGSITLEFDNAFGEDDLILESQAYTTANKEVLKINKIKYIISNIVLTKADGTTYIYPKSESYFIASETGENGGKLELKNVPAGDYTKLSFGIGVDESQWALGATGQGNFLALAQTEQMIWSWAAGYKFIAYEGTFTSATVTESLPFMVHTGKIATNYNYTEVSLDFGTKALVRTTITPQVHIITDLSKILDGPNTIKLSDNNPKGTGAMIMGGTNLSLITENVATMFRVDHVHNN